MISAGPYACAGMAATNGRKEERQQKTGSGNENRESGSAAGFDSGGRFDEGACSGRPQRGSDTSGDCVHQHRALDLRQLSVLVEKARARRESDQRAHGVHKGHDEDGENDGKCAPGESAPRKSSCQTIGVTLGGALTMLCGGAAIRTRKATIAVITMPSRIAPGILRITRTAIRTNPNMATSAGCEVRFPALHRRARNAQPHEPSFVQADEGEKQSDSHGEAVAERSRHAIHNPLPQAQNGHGDEQHTCDENGGQRRLPGKAQYLGRR